MKKSALLFMFIVPLLGMCQAPKGVKRIIEYRYGIDDNWNIKDQGYKEVVKCYDKKGLKTEEITFDQKGDTLFVSKYDYDSLMRCYRIRKYNGHGILIEDNNATQNASGKLIPFIVRDHPSMSCNSTNNQCKFDKRGNRIEMIVFDESTRKNLYKVKYEYLFW